MTAAAWSPCVKALACCDRGPPCRLCVCRGLAGPGGRYELSLRAVCEVLVLEVLVEVSGLTGLRKPEEMEMGTVRVVKL